MARPALEGTAHEHRQVRAASLLDGDPRERDPAKVTDDVLDELISVEIALRDSRGVVSARHRDRAATERSRIRLLADVPALSRLKHGFESRRERQSNQCFMLTSN